MIEFDEKTISAFTDMFPHMTLKDFRKIVDVVNNIDRQTSIKDEAKRKFCIENFQKKSGLENFYYETVVDIWNYIKSNPGDCDGIVTEICGKTGFGKLKAMGIYAHYFDFVDEVDPKILKFQELCDYVDYPSAKDVYGTIEDNINEASLDILNKLCNLFCIGNDEANHLIDTYIDIQNGLV